MINLRYHIVSIVAVFLALGIGIATGTSLIDGFIVDRLERSVADLEGQRQADERRIVELEARLAAGDARAARDEAAVLAAGLSRRLDGVDVMIVTVEDVGDDVVGGLRTALVGSGAEYVGALVLSSALALADDDALTRVASLLDVDASDRGAVARRLSERLRAVVVPPEGEPSAAVAGSRLVAAVDAVLDDAASPELRPPADALAPPDDLLLELVAAGLADYETMGVVAADLRRLPRPATRYVVLGGPGVSPAGRQVLWQFVRELTAIAPTPAVVASTAGPEGAAPYLEPFRDGDQMGGLVATVDGVDRFAGIVATVMALDRVGSLDPAHYGRRADADRLLPVR